MSDLITFKHSGTLGDIIASLHTVRAACEKIKRKAKIYLVKNMAYTPPAQGVSHPTRNEHGEMVMLNDTVIDMIKPLLLAQSFIEEVQAVQLPADLEIPVRQIPEGEINCDLDSIRTTYVAMGRTPIQRWYFYVFPQLTADLSRPVIFVPEAEKNFAKGKVIINRTERFINENIKFDFLKEHEDDIMFFGTMKEYNNFCMRFNLNIQKLPVKNFLELAQAIEQSDFCIGNQSFFFQVCEAMGHPRILEVCDYCPDVTPFTPHGVDFLSQIGLEHYFSEMKKGKRW